MWKTGESARVGMAEREKDRHKLWEVVDAVNGESVRNKEKGDHKNEGWQLGVV